MRFKSLKFKILFWFIGIISSVLISSSLLIYILLEQNIHGEIELQLKNKTKFIQENILIDFSNEKIKLYSNLLNIEFVIFKNKKILYASNEFPLENIEYYHESKKMFFIHGLEDKREDAILRTKFQIPYDGEIILYLKKINDKAEKIQEILTYVNPLIFLFLLWIGNKLIDKILVPIKKLTKSIENVNISDIPNKIVTTNENNEMLQLINSFNEMIERMRQGIDTLNNFNHDISHELKTPITVVNATIELCLRKKRDSEYYENSIRTIQFELNQIQKIIDELFFFTKYSKETIQKTFKQSNLDSILMDVLSKYEKDAADKNITINIDKIENIKMNVNSLLINIIFSNLVDNAIKYTPKGKQIFIELSYKNEKIYFRIEDEGIGIEKVHMNKLTDKFYRVDQSRNKKIKGFGLGLSIVKNFVSLHNGNLDINSTYNKGTVVLIHF